MATKFTASQDLDVFKEEKDGRLREVGNQAVWSLSSCKPGNSKPSVQQWTSREDLCTTVHLAINVLNAVQLVASQIHK